MQPQEEFLYSGYALTSGCFHKKDQLYYVTGRPRGYEILSKTAIYGSIYVFAFKYKMEEKYFTDRYETNGQTLYGDQFGEYFGAALAAGDINGDGLDDIVVGAPYRTNDKNGYNHGSVYVIYGDRNSLQRREKDRIDGNVANGLFGSAVMFLGNLDKEGYQDFAVSAPNEDTTGVVYIYTFDQPMKPLRISQRISGKQISHGLRGFGMSFSRPTDIDDNQFSDIAIGSPISGHAVILRTRQLVRVHTSIEAPNSLKMGENMLSFNCCYSYTDYPGQSLSIVRTIAIDVDTGLDRFAFNHSKSGNHTEEKLIKMEMNKPFCENVTIMKVDGVTNYKVPISITLTYRIDENRKASEKNLIFITKNNTIRGNDTFCKTCPIVSKKSDKSKNVPVMWVDDCGGKKCVSELIVGAKFGNLSNNTYILGSMDPFNLEVNVSNSGDPALLPSLEISLPSGVNMRKVKCEKSDIIGKIICSIGEELKGKEKVTYLFELSIDESTTEKELNFFLNSSTITKNRGNQSSLNIPLRVASEAHFEITGESKEFNYAYVGGAPVFVQNIFKIFKIGPSPMPESEAVIIVPYKIRDSKGTYHQFADIRQFKDANKENPLVKCENMTDYEVKKTRKRRQTDIQPLDNADANTIRNITYYPMLDPTQMLNLNCTMDSVKCAVIKCQVGPFEVGDKYVDVAIEMDANFDNIEDMLKPKDAIMIIMSAKIHGGDRSNYTEVSNLILIQKENRISLWIIISSAVVGFVLLVVLSICLAKAGFFERKDQQKLNLLKEEALEEERIYEAMIEQELANGNFTFTEDKLEENPSFDVLIRSRELMKEADEKNLLDENISKEN